MGMDLDDDDATELTGAAEGTSTASLGSGAGPGSPADGPKGQTLTSVPDTTNLAPKVKVRVELKMTPPPKKSGGNLFLAGFVEIDEQRGTPKKGSFPDHYIPVAIWVDEFPWKGELELVPGLHYFARYGHSSFPEPRDRSSWPLQAPGKSGKSLVFDIGSVTQLSGQAQEELNAANLLPVGPDGQVLPLRNLRNSDTVNVAVRLTLAKDLTVAPGPKRIGVVGFDAGPKTGSAAKNQEPVFLWSSKPQDLRFPGETSVPIPTGLSFMLIVATSEGFNFSEDDLTGDLSPAIKSSTKRLTYPLDSRYGAVANSDQPETAVKPTEFLAAKGVDYTKVRLKLALEGGLKSSQAKGHLFIIGTPEGKEASSEEKPAFLWASDAPLSDWPAEVETLMPSGLDVMLFLDLNGDRAPDVGDLGGPRLDSFTPPKDSKLTYTFTGPWDPKAKKKTNRLLEVAKGVEYSKVNLTLSLDRNLKRSKAKGRLFIIGTPEGKEVSSKEKPAFLWASDGPLSDWPAELEAPMPAGLDVVLFLDLNGDRAPDKRDLAGARLLAFSPPKDSKLTYKFTGPWDPKPKKSEKKEQQAIQIAPGVSTAPVTLQVSIGSRITDKMPRGRLVIAGHRPGAEIPKGETPPFAWMSPDLVEKWPATVQALLPANLDIHIFLDVNTNNSPDKGDLIAGKLKAFTPTPNQKVAVQLESPWKPAESNKGPMEVAPGVKHSPLKLTVEVPRKYRRSGLEGYLLVSASVPGPSAATSERPAFFWSSADVISEWPATLDVVVPHDLDVRIVIDRNKNRKPDPEDLGGDLLSAFKHPSNGELSFTVTGPYERAVPPQDTQESKPSPNTEPFPGR